MMKSPSVRPGLLISPIADGYVVYDIDGNQFHELNATAALLLELCDGKRTVDDLVTVASDVLPEGSDEAIREWVDQAADVGLLIESVDASGSARDMSAAELSDLADKLREEGKVQAAYRCQEHAVGLSPDDADRLRNLGELAHIVGKREEARTAYERYLELSPDDAEIRHLLTSLRDEDAPVRVPDECIQQLYQRFASFYESNMVDELGYEGPQHLHDVIKQSIGDKRSLKVLDLGCGTGLAGLMIKDRAAQLVGIDLSPDMIKHARRRNIYDQLQVSEVTQWLTESQDTFDLIMACDTFIYFGNLSSVLQLAASRLAPGGHIAFSVEHAESGSHHLTDNGRYVHHQSHIAEAAASADLKIVAEQTAFLRMEYGRAVDGLFVCLTRASA